MLIDCDTCRAPQQACQDCVMTVLLGSAPRTVSLDAGERDALDVLAGAGLVPPLRLVVGLTAGDAAPESQLDPAVAEPDGADEARPRGDHSHVPPAGPGERGIRGIA